MADSNPLLPLVREYLTNNAASAALTLEALTDVEATAVFQTLPPELAARAFPHLQVSYAASLLESVRPELFKAIVRVLDAKRGATVFMHLSPEARERFLPHLPKKLKSEVQELLTYPENSVGRIMLRQFLSFRKETTAKDAIKKIRLLAQTRLPRSYAYVVDEEDRLLGVLNMFDVLLAPGTATLESLMRKDVFTLHCFLDREEAAAELSKRKYFAAPVVDHEQRLLGIIKAEQLIKGIQEDMTRDLQTMFGAGADERAFSPLKLSLKKRLPWLHVNLATAFLAAAVVALFEDVIARITVLAVFLPVVAGQGGNAGAQSLAIVMRGLVMREIPPQKTWNLVFKEGLLGSINGAVTGVVTALVAWAWYGNGFLGLVIGMGMLLNLFFAGLAGASIPILMKRFGLDPAQCSSIILTTVTDVMGFFAFLGFAVVFQSQLV